MPTSEQVTARIVALLGEKPRTFYEILHELGDAEYRTILQAWGSLREEKKLGRDADGNYLLQR